VSTSSRVSWPAALRGRAVPLKPIAAASATDGPLAAEDLTYAYPYSSALVIAGVTVRLAPGDLTAIIGPNGSGKTTLLRLLSGALVPQGGRVHLAGRPLASFGRQEIARLVAVAPQELAIPFPFTVRQLVEMGRSPHLSGGFWRQRVIIAMALAQQPAFLLLDEPTTHLDIQHQVEVLSLLQSLHRDKGIAVMATMHDLNLAAMYFDRIILLDQGRIVSAGSPAEVFSEERLRQVFHTGLRVERHPTLGTPNIVLVPRPGAGAAASD
jgi:iron complex transport system ATP-binding protein